MQYQGLNFHSEITEYFFLLHAKLMKKPLQKLMTNYDITIQDQLFFIVYGIHVHSYCCVLNKILARKYETLKL